MRQFQIDLIIGNCNPIARKFVFNVFFANCGRQFVVQWLFIYKYVYTFEPTHIFMYLVTCVPMHESMHVVLVSGYHH